MIHSKTQLRCPKFNFLAFTFSIIRFLRNKCNKNAQEKTLRSGEGFSVIPQQVRPIRDETLKTMDGGKNASIKTFAANTFYLL